MSLSQMLRDAIEKRNKSFHDAIKNKNIEEIIRFIKNHPNEKYVYHNDISALAVAANLDEINIYELMVSCRFLLGPLETYKDIVGPKSNAESKAKRMKLRSVIKKYFKDSPDKHVHVLISKSKLSQSSSYEERTEFFTDIIKGFHELNKVKWIVPILKAAATHKDLVIVFDFSRDTVDHLDSLKDNNTYGLFLSKENSIYVGAKGLLNEQNKFGVYGTLAHELCHFIMKILYNNNCKPYRKDVKVKADEMMKIVHEIWDDRDSEIIISHVLNYDTDPDLYHCELIVRVPQILMFYQENPVKLAECQETFKILFDFFEKNVLVDLEREIPLMEAKYQVREMNNFYDVSEDVTNSKISLTSENLKAFKRLLLLKKSQFFSSNSVQLSMILLYQSMDLQSNIFVKLTSLKNDKIFDLIKNLSNSIVKPTVIIDCDEANKKKLEEIVENLKLNELRERIIFVIDDSVKIQDIETCRFDHSLSKLTVESQKELLQSIIKFQDQEISLVELLGENIASVPSIRINDLVQNKLIKIGEEVKFDEAKFHVNRKFKTKSKSAKNCESVLKLPKKCKLIVLSDSPGMGKSTEFKVIAMKLKKMLPSHWIVLIDLKSFVNSYQSDQNVTMNFDSQKKISKFISTKILKLEKLEEKEVFSHLFNLNQVEVLADGYDEISPSFKKFVTKLIVGLNTYTEIRLWIATRPHMMMELKKELKPVVVLNLKPFSKKNQEIYMKNYLKGNGIKGKKLKSTLEKFKVFTDSLKGKSMFRNISSMSPLFLRMIAEVLTDQNFKIEKLNLYSVYRKFIKNTIVRFNGKGSEASNDSNLYLTTSCNIYEFHHKKAIEGIYDEDKELSKLCFTQTSKITAEQMVRVGLMSDNGTGKIDFIHRTFLEFFAADFIFQNFCLKEFASEHEVKLALKVFMKIFRDDSYLSAYSLITVFLDNALECYEFEKCAKTERLQTCFSDIFGLNKHHKLKIESASHVFVTKFVFCLLNSNYKTTTFEWLCRICFDVIENESLELVKKWFNCFKKLLSEGQIEQILLYNDERSRNILERSLSNLSVFKFVLDKVKVVLAKDKFAKLTIQNPSFLTSVFRKDKELFDHSVCVLKEKLGNNVVDEIVTKFYEDRSNFLYRTFTEFFENVFEKKSTCAQRDQK